ncbi:MFS transporter [Paenibacillus sp. CGMCC 1.16610]|uniref:MFS transporter n=1 Tax=Paenibacillus anseongense TaxID=2682845 RepID=A0ABW9U5L6_9BACL|nr:MULTISPECIES: MFS transporter [Paenibacillus]MBA2942573.1 MFS transporter [Paenibacillus sp. CGMCC 1.16610]MVQ35387.1 MFS transporter [Paenibacillus anseongense]
MSKSISKPQNEISTTMMVVLAAACGLIVANLYYSQTLVGPISAALGLPSGAAGLIVTLTQIGYVAGLLFIVPLSDKIENRRLIVTSLAIVVLALILAAVSSESVLFLTAALLIGSGSVVAQILVPLAAYLSSDQQRGRVVGNVMSGLLLGIMLARPISSLIAGIWGWRTIFVLSAVVMALLALSLARVLPKRSPESTLTYTQLVASLIELFKKNPILRRRAFYQACLFGSFSLFWTTVPLRLADEYGMSQQGIALFALVGVAGAIAAPIAGRLADKGLTKVITIGAIVTAILSFLLIVVFHNGSLFSLILLFVVAVTLDMAVSGNLVASQRIIFSLGNEARGRFNGLFMAIFFIGGAVGSFLGGLAYAHGGWVSSACIGVALTFIAFLYFLTERKSK